MNEKKNKIIVKALNQGYATDFTDEGVVLIDKNGNRSKPHEISVLDETSDLSSLFESSNSREDEIDAKSAGDLPADISTDELIIYTDGGSRGNPGPSASGYVIMDSQENILEEGGEYLGITTNNQAEYQAVKTALEAAVKFNIKTVKFKIDSLLVVNQMIGKFKIKNRDLWPIHSAIKTLIKEHFEKVTFTHVRREFNKLADQKVNEVLDARKN